MKKLFKQAFASFALLTAAFIGLSSFVSTSPAGGECFEIYQGSKLVLQRCGKDMNTVQTISLAGVTDGSELTVKYFHCGQIGKNRTLTVKTSDGKILKEWKFADATGNAAGMKCGVKEIMNVKVSGNAGLRLYYSSKELPGEKLLAIINTKTSSAASSLP